VLKYAVRAYKEDTELFDKKLLLGLAMLDLAASHQTTSYGSSNAVLLLLQHRESWEQICSDPALIPGAVDECLRFSPPLYSWWRTAKKDTEINGVPIPAGGRLLLFMGAGNFDPEVFDDPDRFDIRRPNAKKHLTFGYGPHTCLGNPLARLEIKVSLEELTRRLPHMRLAEPQEIEFRPTASARAPRAFHVEWDPERNPLESDRPSARSPA
jgi:cytochrome P450